MNTSVIVIMLILIMISLDKLDKKLDRMDSKLMDISIELGISKDLEDDEEFLERVRDLKEDDEIVKAVKLVRDHSHMSLKDAKDFVDRA